MAEARGGSAPPVPEVGPDDVRNAAVAFNAMNDQVTRTLGKPTPSFVWPSATISQARQSPAMEYAASSSSKTRELRQRLLKSLDELQDLTEAVLSAGARHRRRNVAASRVLQALVDSVCADLDDLGEPVGGVGRPRLPRLLLDCHPDGCSPCHTPIFIMENAVTSGKKADVEA